MAEEKYPINIWINEERYEELRQAGLADRTREVLAGMRVLQLECSRGQKDRILELFPNAKYDASTTRSIELIPPEEKDRMFRLVIENRRLDVIDTWLERLAETGPAGR